MTNLHGGTQAAVPHGVWNGGGEAARTEQAAYLALTDSVRVSVKAAPHGSWGQTGLSQSVKATHRVSLGTEHRAQSPELGTGNERQSLRSFASGTVTLREPGKTGTSGKDSKAHYHKRRDQASGHRP